MNPLLPVTEAIVSTLAFFAMFSRPLQAEEIVQYACSKYGCTRHDIWEALKLDSRHWYVANGYYYLTAAKYTRSIKELREINERYIAKTRKYIPFLRHIPYVRSVSVVNTVAFGAAKEESDIDLFIITARGKLWIARFLVTLWLHLNGVRRHGAKTKGRFCLSFFIDETEKDLSSIALPEGDIYLSFWVATMLPVWESETYRSFIQKNREGLLRNISLANKIIPLVDLPVSSWQIRLEKWCQLRVVGWLQKLIVNAQKAKMRYLPVSQNNYSSVVVTDSMLKFHNNDRRSRYATSWKILVHKAFQD